MRSITIAGLAIAVALAITAGCGRPSESGRPTAAAQPWVTYASPDGRVRFDHPAGLALTTRPRRGGDDPDLALHGSTPDEAVQFTLVLRVSNEPLDDYCRRMIDTQADGGTTAITDRQALSLGGGQGFRQEFRERAAAPVEFIAVAVEAYPTYVHVTAGYPAGRKAEARPVCERIIASLALHE